MQPDWSVLHLKSDMCLQAECGLQGKLKGDNPGMWQNPGKKWGKTLEKEMGKCAEKKWRK